MGVPTKEGRGDETNRKKGKKQITTEKTEGVFLRDISPIVMFDTHSEFKNFRHKTEK